MSTVHAFPVPELLWHDWATVFVGLGLGVGTIFQILKFSTDETSRHRVYTWTNFWLVLSGVIHVRLYLVIMIDLGFNYDQFLCALIVDLDRVRLRLPS